MSKASVQRAESFPFIAVVEKGSPETESIPGVSEEGTLLLPGDESPTWQGTAIMKACAHRPGGKGPRQLQEFWPAQVTITDKRIAFVLEKYDKGKQYGGLTPGATGLAMRAVSGARASGRRRGKVLVGQIIFSEASGADLWERKPLLGSTEYHLAIYSQFNASQVGASLGMAGLELLSAKVPPGILQRALASALAGSGTTSDGESDD